MPTNPFLLLHWSQTPAWHLSKKQKKSRCPNRAFNSCVPKAANFVKKLLCRSFAFERFNTKILAPTAQKDCPRKISGRRQISGFDVFGANAEVNFLPTFVGSHYFGIFFRYTHTHSCASPTMVIVLPCCWLFPILKPWNWSATFLSAWMPRDHTFPFPSPSRISLPFMCQIRLVFPPRSFGHKMRGEVRINLTNQLTSTSILGPHFT